MDKDLRFENKFKIDAVPTTANTGEARTMGAPLHEEPALRNRVRIGELHALRCNAVEGNIHLLRIPIQSSRYMHR